MTEEQLILVDKSDNQIGTAGKTIVHAQGLLHRAISVFIFNDKKELLLQQRAKEKYHSPSLWTNTCCSHPRPGETTLAASERRLVEEMNIHAHLKFFKSFQYKASFENGLTEHELDHIFYGFCNDFPKPDQSEVQSWQYISPEKLIIDVSSHPEKYTAWLKICIDRDIFRDLIAVLK